MLIFVLILLMASPSWAVTKDTVINFKGNTSPITGSITITSSGGNRGLFVTCGVRHLSNVLSGDINGTPLVVIRHDAAGATNLATWVFKLVDPPTGTNTISINQTGVAANIGCVAESMTDVDQTTTTTSDNGICADSGTSNTRTLTTTSTDLLISVTAIATVSASLVKGSGQTDEVTQPFEQTNLTVGMSSQPGSVDGVMSWSWTPTFGNCNSSISIIHSAYAANRNRTWVVIP